MGAVNNNSATEILTHMKSPSSENIPPTKPSEATQASAHIEVENLVIQYGTVTAVNGASFTVQPGEQLTLLGPSGCGKTTMLRAIAGLEQPASGEIRIGGKAVYSSARRINIHPEHRGLSMVFQSYAIWPHMTVFDNVAYGLRVRKMGQAEIGEKVRWALGLVKMGDYEKRAASKLSGGQQQRVALARAFVFSPAVLLFDEPLSNLDAKLRAEMRIELRELQHRIGITSVYVTHDLEEALAISDRIVVMRDGIIEQIGAPTEIYNRPRNAFVADFVGSANLIRGRLRPELAHNGLIALETPGGSFIYGFEYGRKVVGSEGVFSVRTVHMKLSTAKPSGEVNAWPVRVRRSIFQGDFTQYQVEWENRELVIRCYTTSPFTENAEAWLAVDPQYCVLLES
jgi:iron(III) transport system ATP-binding protein